MCIKDAVAIVILGAIFFSSWKFAWCYNTIKSSRHLVRVRMKSKQSNELTGAGVVVHLVCMENALAR